MRSHIRAVFLVAVTILIALGVVGTLHSQNLLTFPNWTTPTRVGASPGAVGFNTQTNLPEYLDDTLTWTSFGAGGSVTSVTGGCGLSNSSPNPLTSTGTMNSAIPVSATVTSSSYTLAASDSCNLVMLKTGASTVTVPATSTSGFGVGHYWWINNQSGGTVTLNITSPSNLDGGTTISVVNTASLAFQSDGTNYHYLVNSNTSGGGGSGTVASVTGGCGLSNTTPNPIIAAGTLNAAIPVSNTITASSYTMQAADTCNLLLLQSGSSTVTVPAASTSGFGNGNYWYVDNQSGGTITLSITSPSNLDGSATVSVLDQSAFAFQSDGTNYHFAIKSAPGIGTVTTVSGTCGISTTNPTSAPVVSNSLTPIVVTANTPPIIAGYCGELVRLNNASPQTATIAQAGSTGFQSGWSTTLCNIGAGSQTITPSSGTIGGLANYLLLPGSAAAPTCIGLVSNGVSDYNIVNGQSALLVGATTVTGGTTGNCLTISSGVLGDGACGGGGGISTITAGTNPTSGITSGNLISATGNLVTDSGISSSSVGTVTSVSAACGNTTGIGSITVAGTVTGLFTPTLLTGTNQPITAGYCGGVEYLQNGSNQIPTIAEAGTTGFPVGWFTDLCNSGAGTQTVTPAAGTIGGAATKVIAAGSQSTPTCIRIVSDGVSNYYIR